MKTNILKDQIVLVKGKIGKLISDISIESWFETPDVLNTNLNWQIGHIILANYLHGIASISGASAEFREKVNVPDFLKFYGQKSKPSDFKNEKPSREKLMEVYELTFSIILKGLANLQEEDLGNDTAIPNPAAGTKYQALLHLPL
jgi:hypothetical protein